MHARSAEATLRPMHAGDLDAVHRLVVQWSWPHRRDDCALLIELGDGVVAMDAAWQVVGVGMWWGFGADVGTVGMVMVAPEHQGRGIGHALMTALIAAAGPRALMLNATAAAVPLYERRGFRPVGLVRQHQGQVVGPAVVCFASRKVRPALPTDRDALSMLDAVAFGADRTALIARLVADGAAWVMDGGAGLDGFAIVRTFGRGQLIGPVVAANEDDAIALIATAARTSQAGLLRVDIPAHAQRLAAWLTEAGLPAIDTVTSMVRGTWPQAQARAQRFGLTLQALG